MPLTGKKTFNGVCGIAICQQMVFKRKIKNQNV